MMKLTALLSLLLCTTACASKQHVPAAPKQPAQVTVVDTPKCVPMDRKQAIGYAVVIHSLAFVVAQDGGGDEVTGKVSKVEAQLAMISIRDLYQFAKGESQCWSLTKAQAKANMKVAVVLVRYIEQKSLKERLQEVVQSNAEELGTDGDMLFSLAAQATESLMEFAGLKPVDK